MLLTALCHTGHAARLSSDTSWPPNRSIMIYSLIWCIGNKLLGSHGSGCSESGLVCCDTMQFCSLLPEYMMNMAVHCTESKFYRRTPITSLWAVNNNRKCRTIDCTVRCTVQQRRTVDWNAKNFNVLFFVCILKSWY